MKRSGIHARAGGWTLIEVSIAGALLAPLLIVLGNATRAAIGSLGASEQAAETSEVLVKTLGRVERILRAGRSSTLCVQATAADVAAGRAGSVGSWFYMPSGEERTGIDLWSATGERGLELVLPSQRYRMMHVLDGSEARNGVDDDGDGLVDEGHLQLVSGARTDVLVDDVELCTFERDGDTLRFALSYVRKDSDRRLRRTTVRHTVVMRNP